jgi:hypothetical protein
MLRELPDCESGHNDDFERWLYEAQGAEWEAEPEPRPPLTLCGGRIVRHVFAPNGSQDVIPTTGPRALTWAEYRDYVAKIKERRP